MSLRTRGSAASTASRPKVSATSRATRRAAADWTLSRLRTTSKVFIRLSFVQLYHAPLLQRAIGQQRFHERAMDVVDGAIAEDIDVPPHLGPGGVFVRGA